MRTQLRDDTNIEEHLEAALETAEDGDTKYHIRESLQKLQVADG
jgi:hypothetical protein